MARQWMTGWLSLETAPMEERSAGLGEPNYYERARDEAERHIALIRKTIGPEPAGIKFRIKENPHDFGTYISLDVDVREDDDEALAYARRIENEDPLTWEG